VREETLTRQKKLGVVPADTQLTKRPEQIPAWDSLSPDQKRLYAHMMEVYAGALSHADNEIGRLVDAVRDSGQIDKTLIIYEMGDNGASAEGTLQGTTNEVATAANGVKEDLPFLLSMIDQLGGPTTCAIYKDGWMASTTPLRLPWVTSGSEPNRDDFKWELYNVGEDFTQANNLAEKNPAKLKELQAAFDVEAKKYNVYPLDSSFAGTCRPGNSSQPNQGTPRVHLLSGNDSHPRRIRTGLQEQVVGSRRRGGNSAQRREWRPRHHGRPLRRMGSAAERQ
jgi:arylsulfatase A-like enzyme